MLASFAHCGASLGLLIAQTAQIGTGVVDTLMAGNYGDIDLAAIAVGFNIWLPLYLIILGTLFACSAIVAQDFGAGRIERCAAFFRRRSGWRWRSAR